MSVRAYYNAAIRDFLNDDDDRILGILTAGHHHSLEGPQRWAWQEQLKVLKRNRKRGKSVGSPEPHGRNRAERQRSQD